jgi:alpha-D-xyloside xylohydrolase
MFGPKYLVAPVTVYGAKNRSVYLPQLPRGEAWAYSFNRSITHAGGRRIVVDTPLEEFPLFLRITV